MADDGERYEDQECEEDDLEVEEVNHPVETQASSKKKRLMNYDPQEDISLCLA